MSILPARREIIIADASSLRQLALADGRAQLCKICDIIIVIDIVALELAADLEAPGARLALEWIAAGTAPGSLAPIEISKTEVGSLLRLARQIDPRVPAQSAGRRAVIDFVAERLENADVSAVVISEDDLVVRATAKNGGRVTTAHRILMRAREAEIEARYPGLPEGIGRLETEGDIEAAAVALSKPVSSRS